MPKKLEMTDIKSRIDSSIEILSKVYVNSGSHLYLKCRRCKTLWNATWHNINSGSGCPKCGYIRAGKTKRLSRKNIKIKLEKKNIQLLKLDGNNFHCKCGVCDVTWKATRQVLYKGCPHCGRNKQANTQSLTLIELRKRAKILCPDITIPDQPYKNNLQLLAVQCRKCNHSWNSPWTSLQRNLSRCSICFPQWIKEEQVRTIIERLTGWKFPTVSPANSPIDMELDGYNAKHQVAFEYQGEWHYQPHWSYNSKPKALGEAALIRQKLRDEKKRLRCHRTGILLIRVPYFKRDTESFIQAKLKH